MIEPARLAGGAVLRSQSDERLIDLVRAGNNRAFEAIVHRYRRPLLRYCGRFLTAPRAEDAVQHTFMNAYRAMKADERPIDLRPWLYRIAHNASLTALRSGAAEEPISEEIDGVERPDQAVERSQSLADVVAAVQALPPRQRDALILHELEGRSYEQIAAELKISGGAVRQLLSRARTTLRAGATALVPESALVRLASAGNEPVATRVAEIVVAGGGTAVIAKVGTAFVVAGAVAVGAAEGPVDVTGDERKQKREAVSAAAAAGGGGGGGAGGAGEAATASVTRGDAAERRERVKARSRDDHRPSGGRDPSRDTNEDREDGFIRTDDDGGSESDSTGDDSGSGSIEDRSGSNSGSDGGESSGPGSGGDDSPDSSGPGDGTVLSQEPIDDDSGSGSSGSGSGGGSSGSGSSGSGSGSGSSGSSDSSGSGSDDD